MYIVKIYNNGIETEIHGKKAKLKDGSVVKGINTIDSFSFTMLPSNPGFSLINDYKTIVTVYNSRKKRTEYYGRVLYSTPEMDDSGLITKSVVCESYIGFLCDSKQRYVTERNWTVTELWQHIISVHNEQVEPERNFHLGEVTVEDTNDNLYLGIQRDDTWKTINDKLIDKIGGEVRIRVVDGLIYIDHLAEIGARRTTKIALSRNMKSIRKENDPSAYISRLIPLGAKLTDAEGNETEERLDITSVNNGLDYIEDVDAKNTYGIRVDYAYFDDVTTPSILKSKGEAALRENNRVKIKYSITTLDLSLLGLDIDDFEVCDYYPIVNALLGIDDIARIVKKTIDVCDETKSTIEVGDAFKTLSDIQAEQSKVMGNLVNSVGRIENTYVSNNTLIAETRRTNSYINQYADGILASVEEVYAKKSTLEEQKNITEAELLLLAESFSIQFTETNEKISQVDGDMQSRFNQLTKYFTFDINGLTLGQIDSPYKIVIDNDDITIYAYGVAVQEFKADGNSIIQHLAVTKTLNLLGLQIEEDETHINCGYVGGV